MRAMPWWLKVTLALCAGIVMGSGLASCDEANNCTDAAGHWGACKPVQVWSNTDNAQYIETRIEGALRENDGITVNVYDDVSHAPGPAITIIDHIGKPILVMSKDHWLDDDTAAGFANQANQANDDHVTKVIKIIKLIHHFQDTHPRPVSHQDAPVPPQPQAKPAPPGDPLWDPFVHLMNTVLDVVIIGLVALVGAGSLVFVGKTALDGHRTWKHNRRLKELKRNADCRLIAARADAQVAALNSGDLKAGTFGEFQPVEDA